MNERMKWSEAEAVVRAYRAEHGAGTDVAVTAVADALGTDVAEVRRLARSRRRFTDRSGVLSAGLAFGILFVALLTVGPSFLTKAPVVASLPPTPLTIGRSAPVVILLHSDRDGSPPGPDPILRLESFQARHEPM